MKFLPRAIPDVVLVVPKILRDPRGFFMETWEARKFAEGGIVSNFVQDNHSKSARGTLRGLHYQIRQPQGKLVRVISGLVFDVAVDLRRSSPTFGVWCAEYLSEENRHMLWIPPGFAHGFLALSDEVELLYKCSDFYAPEHDRSLRWNDPTLAITWPLEGVGEPQLSDKDRAGASWDAAEFYA